MSLHGDFDHDEYKNGISLKEFDLEFGTPVPVLTEAEIRAKLEPELPAGWLERLSWQYRGSWSDIWRHAPVECFDRFSLMELLELHNSTCVESDIWNHLDSIPKYRLLAKIQSSYWRWGLMSNCPIDELARHYKSIAGFYFHPEFEATLDMTTGYNEQGYSLCSRTYLDGPLAFLLWYKGKHVMTIGFALMPEGLVLSQIQLKEKKGNRWLYKLPIGYFDLAIERVRAAFPDQTFWFPTGESKAAAIRASYDDQHEFADGPYVTRIYDQKFENWKRGRKLLRRGSLMLHPLLPRQKHIAAA